MKEPRKHHQGQTNPGTLIMLANHIGRPEDMPLRSIQALQISDLLIFEEDRPARSALKTAKVHRDYLKFSEHQQKETLTQLRNALLEGKTATYMSDQGCPTLADPGGEILRVAYACKATVRVVPGPSSLTAAIMACPFPIQHFYFAGFLPREPAKRLARLQELRKRREPLVLMDTPYRLQALLEACQEAMGPRHGFLALNISEEDETYLSGTFRELVSVMGAEGKKNFILILEAAKNRP